MNQLKDLQVWQKAMTFASEIYSVTGLFPEREKFGMVLQMNRAAISIPSNIAEGAGRESKKEFIQFLNIAMGSCYEIETQIILATEFGYITDQKNNQLLNQVYELQKMLVGLRKFLRTDH